MFICTLCIKRFSFAVISRVLARKHVLLPLTVQPYYKWLGNSAASDLQTHMPHESRAVLEKVTDFIESNSVVQKFVPLLRPVVDLLVQFMASDVNKITSKLQQCGGHLKRANADSEPGFVLLGSRAAVELASSELMKLVENLAVYDHEIDRAGIPAYLLSAQGTAILSDLQRRHQAIIYLENCSESSAEESSPGGRNMSTAPVVTYSRKVS